MDKKELSVFELATVKRTAASTKRMRTRREKLMAEIILKQQEVESLELQIEAFEAPIKILTDGFTSEQVLNGEMDRILSMGGLQDAEIDETPLEETPVDPANVGYVPSEPVEQVDENHTHWNAPTERKEEN